MSILMKQGALSCIQHLGVVNALMIPERSTLVCDSCKIEDVHVTFGPQIEAPSLLPVLLRLNSHVPASKIARLLVGVN